MDGGWPTGAHNQQGSTSSISASQIFVQLNQLYAILQRFIPEWCQQNPFWSMVDGRSDAQLCELYVTWTQCVEYFQAQSRVTVPMGDTIEQQPRADEIDQRLNDNPDTQQSSESFAFDGLDDRTNAFSIAVDHNPERAETPRRGSVGNYGIMGNSQGTPVPTPPPLPDTEMDAIGDNSTISLPDWFSLVRPQPKDQVVTVRRECQVTFEINLKGLHALPGQEGMTWKGLVIPSTAGVRAEEYAGERGFLHLSLRVFGANTNNEHNAVCIDCSTREGKKKGTPSLVDFHAVSDIIRASDDRLVRVKFKFSCYPKHQNPKESAYLLEVALLEKQPQGHAVESHRVLATFRLPWHFRLGKASNGRVACAAPAGGIVPPQNGSENPGEQHPVTGDTPTPRPCVEAVRRVPRGNEREVLVQPTSALSLSSGGPQVIPTSYSHPDIPFLHPDPNLITSPSTVPRKRRWDAADLDDGNVQTATGRPRMRPRLAAMDNVGAGSRTSNVRPNPSRPHPTVALTGHGANPALRGPDPSNGRSAISTASVTPAGPPPLSPSDHDSETTPEPSHNRVTQQGITSDTREGDIPGTDGVDTALQSTNPDHGPVTGGIPIWLSVVNPPTEFPLFARFGTNVTAAFFVNPNTLVCKLPSASSPGRVRVTLSRYFDPNQPQFGASMAEFVYKAQFDQLVEILLLMKQAGSPDYTPEMQAILNILNPPKNEQPPHGRSDGTTDDANVESSVIQALLSLHTQPNFQHVVSISNDYSQTLAHLSVLYGFKSLLGHLIDWDVDLAVADNNGLTALHCAYLAGDRHSILLLRRGGALTSIPDQLGRVPLDLWPGGPDSASEVEAGIAEDLKYGPPTAHNDVDEQVALGAQFDALDDACYGEDSGDGGSSSDPNEPDDVQDVDDHCPVGVTSSTFSLGPSTSRETTVERMNQLLKSRRSRKKRSTRIIPDTPHDTIVSNIAQKLRESEAEPAAIEYLCNEVFPSGTINLEGLRAPMSTQEIQQFQAEEGAQKYRGLLIRERGVFSCRLCPEDNKLDFKDSEEALHHITKSHFDMGYSCACGCNQIYWRSGDLKKHKKETAITGTSHEGIYPD